MATKDIDWRRLGPRKRQRISATLSDESHLIIDQLAEGLGISRGRVVDLLICRAGIRSGWVKAVDLNPYAKADQKRLGVWWRRRLRQLRRDAKAAAGDG